MYYLDESEPESCQFVIFYSKGKICSKLTFSEENYEYQNVRKLLNSIQNMEIKAFYLN